MIFVLSIQLLICITSTEDAWAKSSSSSSLFNHHLNSLLRGDEFRGGGAHRARSRKRRKSTLFSSTINTMPLEDKIDISQDYYNNGNDFYPIDQTAKTKSQEPLPPPSLPEYDWSEVELGTNSIQRRDTDKEGHRNTNNRVRLNIPIGDYHQDEFSESDSDYHPSHNNHDISQLSHNNDTFTASNVKDKPVIYRYFGRSRTQSRSASIPFILIGPSIEHWKITGQVLASRGFNVIACERVMDEESETRTSPDDAGSNRRDESEGEGLVTAVLDALRWKKAILVGCDRDAAMAIEAAMRLAPDRIAGLVLCGDMRGARDYVTKLASEYDGSHNINEVTTFDDFLLENVGCPSTVVWDGDMYRWLKSERKAGRSDASVDDVRQEIRIPIVGGGSSPHRRLPEHFAWVLSRFVEQKVNFGDYDDDYLIEDATLSSNEKSSHRLSGLSKNVPTALSAESLLVVGRVLATAIIYGCTARIGLYHYQNLRFGITGIKSKCSLLTSYGLKGLNFILRIASEDLERKYSIIKLLASHLSFRRRHRTSSIDDAPSKLNDDDNTSQFESNRDEEEDERGETKLNPDEDESSVEDRLSPLRFLLGLDSVAA